MCPVFVCPSACGVRLCRSNRLKMFLVRVCCKGGKWITPWLVKNPFVHETSGVTAQQGPDDLIKVGWFYPVSRGPVIAAAQ